MITTDSQPKLPKLTFTFTTTAIKKKDLTVEHIIWVININLCFCRPVEFKILVNYKRIYSNIVYIYYKKFKANNLKYL